MTNRRGHSLVELLATLATLAALAAVAAGVFRLASRTLHLAADRAEALDATRTAAALLERELRPLANTDFVAFRDSIVMRAFRGYAIPCDTLPPLRARYVGVRPPDATKDSIIALTDTAEHVAALASAASAAAGAPCTPLPGEQLVTLAAARPLPPAAVWLIYEHGAYSVGAGALRYRRGLGGRQPVTAPAFDDASSGFAIDTSGFAARAGGSAVVLSLAPAHARAKSFTLPATVRLRLPNTDSTEMP